MYHPTTRVLAVLELLQAHGRMTGAELAARLEVDVRTLRRYITMLQDLGLPVTAERGRHGAYTLGAGLRLPPLVFTNPEAVALALGLLAARRLGLAEAAPAVESARAKLERVLPVELQAQVRALSETIALDLDGPEAEMAGTALEPLSQAAQRRQRVRLRYQALDGAVTERPFDAYGLVYLERRWYAVGYCGLRRGLRSFRLDRVLSVELTEARFERPAAFDPLAFAQQALARVPRAIPFEVFIDADAGEVRRLRLGRLGEVAAEADGALLRGHTDDVAWLARQLAPLPCGFAVRAPDELRAALRVQAERLAKAAQPGSTDD